MTKPISESLEDISKILGDPVNPTTLETVLVEIRDTLRANEVLLGEIKVLLT